MDLSIQYYMSGRNGTPNYAPDVISSKTQHRFGAAMDSIRIKFGTRAFSAYAAGSLKTIATLKLSRSLMNASTAGEMTQHHSTIPTFPHP
jgi:hypothetical protein